MLSNMNISKISQLHYLHFEIQPEDAIALTLIHRSLHGHQHMQPPISILIHNYQIEYPMPTLVRLETNNTTSIYMIQTLVQLPPTVK